MAEKVDPWRLNLSDLQQRMGVERLDNPEIAAAVMAVATIRPQAEAHYRAREARLVEALKGRGVAVRVLGRLRAQPHAARISRVEICVRPVPRTWAPKLRRILGVTEAMLEGHEPFPELPPTPEPVRRAADPALQREREASRRRMLDPERRKWIVGRCPRVSERKALGGG